MKVSLLRWTMPLRKERGGKSVGMSEGRSVKVFSRINADTCEISRQSTITLAMAKMSHVFEMARRQMSRQRSSDALTKNDLLRLSHGLMLRHPFPRRLCINLEAFLTGGTFGQSVAAI